MILLGSVPLALTAALLWSFLGLTTINVYAQIGFITLVGLVAKNGILITEFANQLQRQGVAKERAIREAAVVRLQPVLMTTLATVIGHGGSGFHSGDATRRFRTDHGGPYAWPDPGARAGLVAGFRDA